VHVIQNISRQRRRTTTETKMSRKPVTVVSGWKYLGSFGLVFD